MGNLLTAVECVALHVWEKGMYTKAPKGIWLLKRLLRRKVDKSF